jgi:hypothetical protein
MRLFFRRYKYVLHAVLCCVCRSRFCAPLPFHPKKGKPRLKCAKINDKSCESAAGRCRVWLRNVRCLS